MINVSRQQVIKGITIRVNVTGFKGWWWRTALAMKCFEFAARLLGCQVEVWHTPAASPGMFHRDSVIKQIVSEMRTAEKEPRDA